MTILNKKATDWVAKGTQKDYQTYISIVEFEDGKYGVFESQRPSKAISASNSAGFNDLYPHGQCVRKVVGIKEVTAERNLASVVDKFAKKYGKGNVYSQAIA